MKQSHSIGQVLYDNEGIWKWTVQA